VPRTLSAPVPQQDQQVEDADRAVAVEVSRLSIKARQCVPAEQRQHVTLPRPIPNGPATAN